MNHLLKADFYRLFRSKFYYILVGVAFLLAVLTFALYMAIVRFASAEAQLQIGAMTAEDFQKFSFDGTVGYCAAIAAAIFICGDYAGGGIRNKVLTGCGRKDIYLSKLVAVTFVSVCVYLATQLVVFVCGSIGFGWAGASAYDVASRFVAGLFLAAASGAVFTAISMLSEKLSLSLIVSIVLLFTLSLVMSLLTVAQVYFGSKAFDWFVRVFGWLTPMGQVTLLMGGSHDYWIMSAFSCAWILLSVFVFSRGFQRRDLK